MIFSRLGLIILTGPLSLSSKELLVHHFNYYDFSERR